MAKRDEQILSWRNVVITCVGGIGLLISTSIIQMFFVTPPSRAEFNSLKNDVSNIQSSLSKLEKGQTAIINHLIER